VGASPTLSRASNQNELHGRDVRPPIEKTGIYPPSSPRSRPCALAPTLRATGLSLFLLGVRV